MKAHKYTLQELKALPVGTSVWINLLGSRFVKGRSVMKGAYVRKTCPPWPDDALDCLYSDCYYDECFISYSYRCYGRRWEAWNIDPDTVCAECDDG